MQIINIQIILLQKPFKNIQTIIVAKSSQRSLFLSLSLNPPLSLWSCIQFQLREGALEKLREGAQKKNEGKASNKKVSKKEGVQ